MPNTLIVCLHLLSTCAAIVATVITDLRLLAKLIRHKELIPPPQGFDTAMITVSLRGSA